MKTKVFSLAMIFTLVMALALPTGVLAAPPANDDFDNATMISQFPFNDAISTSEATVAADDPYCSGQSATVWYKVTAVTNVIITANTFGSDYDTTLSVYTGTRGALTQVACNDDYNGVQSFVQFSASAGQTYFFMVSQFSTGGSGGSLVFNIDGRIPPANDDVDNAIAINPLPFIDSRSTVGATTAADDPYCGYRNASVWYTITPTVSGRVDLDTTASNYYADISVFTGSRGAWGYITCSYSRQTSFNAVAGQTYYIMVSTYSRDGGSLVFSADLIPPPANDDVDNAIAIDSLPFTDTRDTSNATTAFDDPYYCGYNGASVWYSFTPVTDTRVELDSSASNYYTTISVWTGPRGAWVNVNCNYSQHVRFNATAGQTYYIMIGTYSWSPGGNLSLSATLAPPPLTVDVQIDPTGLVTPTTGEAKVTGTITCNQSSYINGWGVVQQKIGKGLVEGYVWIYGNCDPSTPLVWESILYSQPVQHVGSGRAATLFTAGPTNVNLYVSAWEPYFGEYAYDETTASVSLRGTKGPIVSYP